MRVKNELPGLILWTLAICSGCNGFGGPEGIYTIDRERTRDGIERHVEQTIANVSERGQVDSAELAATRKSMQEEISTLVDQMTVTLNLERGGTFHAQTRLGEEEDSFEGSWQLRDGKLETTTVSRNGKMLSSPKIEAIDYADGRLSYKDAEVPVPWLVLSRQ